MATCEGYDSWTLDLGHLIMMVAVATKYHLPLPPSLIPSLVDHLLFFTLMLTYALEFGYYASMMQLP